MGRWPCRCNKEPISSSHSFCFSRRALVLLDAAAYLENLKKRNANLESAYSAYMNLIEDTYCKSCTCRGPFRMNHMRTLALTATVLSLTILPVLSDENRVFVDSISVHLFLEKSGKFSKDVLLEGVSAWNGQPVTGSVNPEERFSSYLIKVKFRAEQETFAPGEQARISIVRNKDRKTLNTELIEDVYVGQQRNVTKAILIRDHICGPLTIEVKDHTRTLSKALPWACGE